MSPNQEQQFVKFPWITFTKLETLPASRKGKVLVMTKRKK
jgi:hypothetical protein